MSSEAKEDTFDKATAAAEELYHIRDTFFPINPEDKISKLRELSDLAVKILDSIPPGEFRFHFSYAVHFDFVACCNKLIVRVGILSCSFDIRGKCWERRNGRE